MHRIDGPGATVDNRFTDGDPVGGVQATMVTDDWANDVQEELMSILTAAGIAPVKGDQDQVLAAINQIIAAAIPAYPPDATVTAKGLVELATDAEATAGTDAARAVTPAGVKQAYAQKFNMVVVDEKASSVAGGNNAAGDNTRTLNTVRNNTIVGASLASNQITLPAGTYRVAASVPFYGGDRHRGYLYNVTSGAVAILGTNENAGAAFTTRSLVRGVLTIAAPAVFELRQYCDVVATNGFGDAVIDGRPAVFAEIEFKKEG